MLTKLTTVQFPRPRGLNINMMPFRWGDPESLPPTTRAYMPLIDKCGTFPNDSICYLTVSESLVLKGQTQRRPGVHTEAASRKSHQGGISWGGPWGGGGVFMASTDGACQAWDCQVEPGILGEAEKPEGTPIVMAPNTLYQMSDRTPHESLPSEITAYRQFFRLVGPEVSAWFSQHSTRNPLGIEPACTIIDSNKFA